MVEFWDHVPRYWKPRNHFYNVPISNSTEYSDNPIDFIKDIYRRGDFVAFKLDIDPLIIFRQM